jgi:hypothetical protein
MLLHQTCKNSRFLQKSSYIFTTHRNRSSSSSGRSSNNDNVSVGGRASSSNINFTSKNSSIHKGAYKSSVTNGSNKISENNSNVKKNGKESAKGASSTSSTANLSSKPIVGAVSTNNAEAENTQFPKDSPIGTQKQQAESSKQSGPRIESACYTSHDPIPLRNLISSQIPICSNSKLSKRMELVHPISQTSSNTQENGPNHLHVHPTTENSLTLGLSALLESQQSTEPNSFVKRLPSITSGLVVLSSPYKGSQIYCSQLLQQTLQNLATPTVFLNVNTFDLFDRLPTGSAALSPPLKLSPGFSASRMGPSNHKVIRSSGFSFPIGFVLGGNAAAASSGASFSEERRPDFVDIPYRNFYLSLPF